MVMPANCGGSDIGYLAGRYPGSIGHIYSPGGQRGPFSYLPYALDNGAFVSWSKKEPWDESAWRRLLTWAALSGQAPLWVLVPDVVADRTGTLAAWERYSGVVRSFGFRAAFALQDRMTFADVPDEDCMLFLGGTDEWKDAAIGPWCERFPGRVHVGRVNRWNRLVRCWRAGAVSVDGSGWYHRSNGQLAELMKFIRETWRSE